MRKNEADRPTPFEAIMLEPDAAGRQLVLDRAQQMFLASGGADLQLELDSLRDSINDYNASKAAARANPEAKLKMRHSEGQRALSLFHRVSADYQRLRNRSIDFARRAVFEETGKRFGPGLWPEDLPKEEKREKPVQLPNPAESWQPARDPKEAQSADEQWRMAQDRAPIDVNYVARELVAGKIGPQELSLIDRELRQEFADLPEVANEFKRRLAAAVQKLKANGPQAPTDPAPTAKR